jgi:hypothetical protein
MIRRMTRTLRVAAALASIACGFANAQYCVAGNTTPGCPASLSITEVNFYNDFSFVENWPSGCSPSGYESFTSFGFPAYSAFHGEPVYATVTVAGLLPTDGVTIWIDYDKNGTFDAYESFDMTTVPGFGGTWVATGTIATPPCTPQTGTSRMRVAAVRGFPDPQPACGTYPDSDFEDYDYFMGSGTGFGPGCPKVVNLGFNFAPMLLATGTWISFTPPVTGGYTFDTFDAGDNLLGVFESIGGVLTTYTTMVGNGGKFAATLTGGQTYVLHYQNYFNPGSMNVTVTQMASTQPNDACVAATPVGLGTSAVFSLGGSTAGPGPQAACSLYRDVWLSFTAPSTGAYSFAPTLTAPGNSLAVNVYASCGGGTLACGANNAVAQLVSGQTYVLRVGEFMATLGGNAPAPQSFTMTIASAVGPTTSLSVAPGSISIAISGGAPLKPYFMAATLIPGAFPNGAFFGIDPDIGELLLQYGAGLPFRGVLDANGAAMNGPYSGLVPGLTFYVVTLTNLNGVYPIATAAVSITTI